MKHLMAAMAMAGLCLASFVTRGAVIDPTTACNAALDDTPDAVMLKSKMVLDSKIRPDLKMLADERRPTKRDKEAIAAVFAEDQRCRDLGQEFRATFYPPAMVAALDANWNEIKALTAKLYSGKLVYGQFNEQRMAIADAAHLRQANIVQDLRSEKAAREARERSAAQQDAMVQAQREQLEAQRAATEAAAIERVAQSAAAAENLKKQIAYCQAQMITPGTDDMSYGGTLERQNQCRSDPRAYLRRPRTIYIN